MIKTILFDLDGTLLNTIDDLADAANWVCTQHGWPIFPVETYKHFVGNGIPKLVERFSPENARTPEQLAATLAEFSVRYDAHKEDKTAPYPGILELLAALKVEGVQTAVFSNKADAFCGKIIEHYFGPDSFSLVRGSRPGVPTKRRRHPYGTQCRSARSGRSLGLPGRSRADRRRCRCSGRKAGRYSDVSPPALTNTSTALPGC